MKILLALAVLCVAGWLLYTQVLVSPEARTCDRLADLCDLRGDLRAGELASCEEDLGELSRTLGPASVERAAECVSESGTCVEAMACMGASITRDALEGIFRGAARGFGK